MTKKLCKGSSGVGKYMKYRKFKSGKDCEATEKTGYVPQNGICPDCGEDYNMYGGCKCNGYTHGKPIETTGDGSVPYKKNVAKKVKTNLSLMDREAVESEIKRLKDELTAELNNRCCGNCCYSVLLNKQSMGCNGRNQRVITQKNDPACEHWKSCRR